VLLFPWKPLESFGNGDSIEKTHNRHKIPSGRILGIPIRLDKIGLCGIPVFWLLTWMLAGSRFATDTNRACEEGFLRDGRSNEPIGPYSPWCTPRRWAVRSESVTPCHWMAVNISGIVRQAFQSEGVFILVLRVADQVENKIATPDVTVQSLNNLLPNG
jgi:hypothetical protein